MQDLEISNVLQNLKHELRVGRDDKSRVVEDIGDYLEHEVQGPNPVHTDGHEDHEAEGHNQRENH